MTEVIIALGADNERVKEVFAELFPSEDFFYSDTCVLPAASAREGLLWGFWGDPLDRLEASKNFLEREGLALAKIIAVVDAVELERRGGHDEWFEALAHFSDTMLLLNSKQVSPSWLSAWRKKLKDRPMQLFDWPEIARKNPEIARAEILYPEARRLSQYFEAGGPPPDLPLFEGEDDAAAEIAEGEDDDPYVSEKFFERDAAGRRRYRLSPPQ